MLFTEDQEDVFQMWFFKADDKFIYDFDAAKIIQPV